MRDLWSNVKSVHRSVREKAYASWTHVCVYWFCFEFYLLTVFGYSQGLWASKLCITVDSWKRRIQHCQDRGTEFYNYIIFHNCLELGYLSNSITHGYFLLLPCKLDKALISIRPAIGNSLSFAGPHTVLRENFHISKNTRPGMICLTLLLWKSFFDSTKSGCRKKRLPWATVHNQEHHSWPVLEATVVSAVWGSGMGSSGEQVQPGTCPDGPPGKQASQSLVRAFRLALLAARGWTTCTRTEVLWENGSWGWDKRERGARGADLCLHLCIYLLHVAVGCQPSASVQICFPSGFRTDTELVLSIFTGGRWWLRQFFFNHTCKSET